MPSAGIQPLEAILGARRKRHPKLRRDQKGPPQAFIALKKMASPP